MTRKLVSENWRLERARYNMVGSHCNKCDTYHFPKKKVCLRCKNPEELEDYIFNPRGKLVEWTKIYETARGFENSGPYLYAIIELEEGIKISTQLTGVDDDSKLKPGDKVEFVFRKLFHDGYEGLNTYGFKAKPVS